MKSLLLGAVIFAACSTKPPNTTDAGTDAGVRDTGCTKCGDAQPMCPTPMDVSSFVPETLPDPVGKHLNACMQAQLDLYHKCIVQSDMASCMTIQQQATTTFKDCLACLETTVMDAKWGPLVCVDPNTCYLNVEGCVNLATNQMGAMSCGQLLHASYGCQRAACETLCGTDAQGFSKCVQTALASSCQKYGDAFSMTCPNLSFDPDGGFPDLDNCFRRQGEMDSSALRVRMDTYFCGP